MWTLTSSPPPTYLQELLTTVTHSTLVNLNTEQSPQMCSLFNKCWFIQILIAWIYKCIASYRNNDVYKVLLWRTVRYLQIINYQIFSPRHITYIAKLNPTVYWRPAIRPSLVTFVHGFSAISTTSFTFSCAALLTANWFSAKISNEIDWESTPYGFGSFSLHFKNAIQAVNS